MNISELPTKQKSVLLAKAMGINYRLYSHSLYFDTADGQLFCEVFPFGAKGEPTEAEVFEKWFFDLYEAHWMAMAWRVVEWIATPRNVNHPASGLPIGTHFMAWWNTADLWACKQDEFQAAVLDKILELAMAARLVQS